MRRGNDEVRVWVWRFLGLAEESLSAALAALMHKPVEALVEGAAEAGRAPGTAADGAGVASTGVLYSSRRSRSASFILRSRSPWYDDSKLLKASFPLTLLRLGCQSFSNAASGGISSTA